MNTIWYRGKDESYEEYLKRMETCNVFNEEDEFWRDQAMRTEREREEKRKHKTAPRQSSRAGGGVVTEIYRHAYEIDPEFRQKVDKLTELLRRVYTDGK